MWRYISHLNHNREDFHGQHTQPVFHALILIDLVFKDTEFYAFCHVHRLVYVLPYIHFVLLAFKFPTLSPCIQTLSSPFNTSNHSSGSQLVHLMHYKKSAINLQTGFFLFYKIH